jgi:NarL family two-component system sensor histidine kinase LiaS
MLHAYQQRKNEVRRPFFFHRLQWQLTRGYVLVTVALAAAVQIVFYSVAAFMLMSAIRTPDFPSQIAAAMREVAPQFAPHLSTHGQLLLEQFRFKARYQLKLTGGRLSLGANFQGQQDGRDFLDERVRAVWLTDANGQLLATYGDRAAWQNPAVAERLRHAQNGVADAAQLVSKKADGIVIAAVPILEGDKITGVFWAEINAAFGWDLLSGILREMFGQLIWVPLLGLAFGLAFGFITARKLTHRLNHLAYAAGQWAQGRFHECAPEQPRDELGALGERLNQMAAELQKHISLQQQLATMEERNRLALELHDTVKQQLFACAMQISTAQRLLATNPAAAQNYLHESETLTQQMQDELAAVIHELAATKNTNDLSHSLRAFAADWTRQTNIPVALELNGNGYRYAPQIERALLRIAQEALANIARHSAATSATVRFDHPNEHTAQLTICDNGCGFAATNSHHGLGLQSMRERAESLPGGTFTLESNLQQGTRISVSFQPEV